MILDRNELLNLPFTPSIKAFNRSLAELPWQKVFPGAVFIRDYENLPERAPFDIDILVPKSLWSSLKSSLSDCAEKSGLITTIRQGENSLLILVFDPSPNETGRSWAYYEIRDTLTLTDNLVVAGEIVAVDYFKGIPCPNTDWLLLLGFVQAVRKNRLDQKKSELLDLLVMSPTALAFTATKLKISESSLMKYMKDDWRCMDVASVLGISMQPIKQVPEPKLTSVIKRKILRKMFFLQNKSLLLYTLHGSDGVGKTTVSELVEKAFSNYPLPLTTFHHVTGWKHSSRNAGGDESVKKSSKRSPQSVVKPKWRCVLSAVYKRLPAWVREAWLLGVHYIRYCTRLNNLIMDRHEEGAIVLVDRYLHDMWVKNILMLHGGQYIDRLFAHLFRKPRLAILLVDEPEKIHARKQELTVNEIALYQDCIKDVLACTEVRYKVIPVNKRTAEQMARKVIEVLLNDMDNRLINLMRAEVFRSSTNINRNNNA
jgi:hypothetical protein